VPETDDVLLARTESWFVRHGLPYFIEDRKATDDVFSPALPLLLAYSVINLMVVLSLRLTLWQRVGGAALGILLLCAVYMLRNLVKGDKAVGLPRRTGWLEIAGFVLIPPVVDLATRHRPRLALLDLGVDVVVVLAICLVASALLPLAGWALRRTFQELGEVFNLAARALPLLFLFNSFLFISQDVWEFSANMTKHRIWGVVALLALFTMMFLFYQLPAEVRRVAAQYDRTTVITACRSTPLETVVERVVLHEGELPLTRAQRINVMLVLFIGQVLQVLLLGVLVFVFFLGFGKTALTQKLLNDWTGRPDGTYVAVTVFGHPLQDYVHVEIDNRLWQVSLFLAAVSAFFFAISSLTDEVYKAQFYKRMSGELEAAIQVRRVYLALYEGRHEVDVELSTSGVHMLHRAHLEERIGEQLGGRVVEQIKAQVVEHLGEHGGEQIGEQLGEQPGEHLGEREIPQPRQPAPAD
jgi:Ca2+/Na+ antiporter